MSPEALDEPPSYTKKLDSFSFGVLAVQIMTRQFPDPGSWNHICDMTVPRNQCFAVAFSGDTVYVIGGEPRTDSIEIRTIVESGMRL